MRFWRGIGWIRVGNRGIGLEGEMGWWGLVGWRLAARREEAACGRGEVVVGGGCWVLGAAGGRAGRDMDGAHVSARCSVAL